MTLNKLYPRSLSSERRTWPLSGTPLVMGHLHAQVHITKKAGGALPPVLRCPVGTVGTSSEARDHVCTHAGCTAASGPASSCFGDNENHWVVTGVTLRQTESFNLKWQFHWGWCSYLSSPCFLHYNWHLKATYFRLLRALIYHTPLA